MVHVSDLITSAAEKMRKTEQCRLCRSGATSIWQTAGDHEIHTCHQCGFLFATRLAGAPAPNYESEYHCSFIERDSQAATLRQYAAMLKNIESIAPGRRLFDAGCGAGGFLDCARSLGWSVSGADGSQTAVQFAKEEYGLNADVADLNEYEFPRGAYDVIWLFHVVEHPSNPLHLLRTAAEGLVPNGIVFQRHPFVFVCSNPIPSVFVQHRSCKASIRF